MVNRAQKRRGFFFTFCAVRLQSSRGTVTFFFEETIPGSVRSEVEWCRRNRSACQGHLGISLFNNCTFYSPSTL
jgi:hypothetical protein